MSETPTTPAPPATSISGREQVAKWWNDAWTEGIWAASWSKSIEGLTPAQAAWTPAPGRHSIWQNILHMTFWREVWIRRASTGIKPTEEETARGNFPLLTDTSESAWNSTRERFEATQIKVAAMLREPTPANDPLMSFFPHDCYHFGQINLLRALQGLRPIE